jgi:hypothetical protein
MSTLAERIVLMQQKTRKIQDDQVRHEGALRTYMDRLHKTHSCNTIEQAEKRKKELMKKLKKEKTILENLMVVFEENYDI